MASAMASTLPPGLQASVDASKATYKRVGKSGLLVSVPILGAMSFGSKECFKWALEEEEALPILKAAYDAGLNSWDTSNNYSNGVSETIIGKALKKYDIPRHKVVILTKCWAPVSEHENGMAYVYRNELRGSKDYVNQFGLSRAAIFNAVEGSLKRLGTSYIDVFQIHRFDPHTPIEETMEALHDLVKSGKVRYIGASSMWTYQFAMMQFCAEKHGWTKFISMQSRYSLVWREDEREMNKFCNDTGVGLIPWGPLDFGRLARPLEASGTTIRSTGSKVEDMISGDQTIIQRVQEVAEKKGWPMSQVALAWAKKRISSPIIGFSSVARVEEALASRGKELTEEEEKYLEEPYTAKLVHGFL